MLAKVHAATIVGIDALRVEVETQIVGSLRRFALVGLPDGVLREAKDRVRCAIENSGFVFPHGEVVVNLAPAWLQKRGSGFDLAIALSILAADGQIPATSLAGRFALAELALDGRLKPVIGELAAAQLARDSDATELILSAEQASRAACVDDVSVVGARTLLEVVRFLKGEISIPAIAQPPLRARRQLEMLTFRDVVGQQQAKRALQISAAGGHNVLFIGPPGAGKSMLAARLPSLLPELSRDEAIRVNQIYTAIEPHVPNAAPGALLVERPFRAPHHTLSASALVGGGIAPTPGEISLAHYGVLFLDEVAEMRRDALEALRLPLETQVVDVCRAAQRVRFPADFVLVAAMNPCPCGRYGSKSGKRCRCLPSDHQRYANKLSSPIRDRIDLHVWLDPVPVNELQATAMPCTEQLDPTIEMRERVVRARTRQHSRQSGVLNARIRQESLAASCRLNAESLEVMKAAVERYALSARGYSRTLRVARTIADLEDSAAISTAHILEAVGYREQRMPE